MADKLPKRTINHLNQINDKIYLIMVEFKELIDKQQLVGNTVEIIDFHETFPSLDIVQILNRTNEEYTFDQITKDYPIGIPPFNGKYSFINSEFTWYLNGSNKYEEGLTPKVWKKFTDAYNNLNSNYGWLMYSADNYFQLNNVIEKLAKNPLSRQAVAHYSRPSIHYVGGKDYICTIYVSYMIRDGILHCMVRMRSNDFKKGFIGADFAWQNFIALSITESYNKIKSDKAREITDHVIHWTADSMHVYEEDFDKLNKAIEQNKGS